MMAVLRQTRWRPPLPRKTTKLKNNVQSEVCDIVAKATLRTYILRADANRGWEADAKRAGESV